MEKCRLMPLVLSGMLLLTACGGGDKSFDEPIPPTPSNPNQPTPPAEEKVAITINPSVSGSRATDTGFEQNDRIGLYVVNYNGSTAGTLADSGNHVDNMAFTYSGVWTPDSPIYWEDATTHADFYLYFPYKSVSSVSAIPFDVNSDQSTEAAYKASDFIAGKAANVSPSTDAVTIPANHLMSQIEINVAPGNGFTAQTLAAAKVKVGINGLKTQSTVNLASMAVTPAGEAKTVTPLLVNGVYRALVVPQTVEERDLITVNIDGRDFNLKKGFTFTGGKRHLFTVTVSKTSSGINVNINQWDSDGIDNGGVAE